MAANSHRLLDRLQRDLAELREQPYPGVAVFIDDSDFREICLVLTPPAGPWKGLALHFDVRLPPTWPRDPPSISASVHGIPHPNLSRHGSGICCDLLRPLRNLRRGYTGGYTPALTLRGLFLQFLTFFSSSSVEQDSGSSIEIGEAMITTYITEHDLATASTPWDRNCEALPRQQLDLEHKWKADFRRETTHVEYKTSHGPVIHKVKGAHPRPNRIHRFEKRNPRWKKTYDLITRWSCRRCPYGSPDLPHDASTTNISTHDAGAKDVEPSALYLLPPPTCILHLLNDDILLEIASHLPSDFLVTFGQAYLRFQHLMSGHHTFSLRELECFFLKTSLSQAILGIGVAFDEGSRTLSSDFDWLSLEAFEEHGVRKSVQKRDFGFFLPLAFSQSHFERVKKEIWSRVASIDTAVRQANVRLAANEGAGQVNTPRTTSAPGQVAPGAQPHQAFTVLYKMMNDIVVSLMQTCDDAFVPRGLSSRPRPNLLTASEKAVISYCHLMHLLICVCRAEPRLLQDARERARDFLQVPESATKVSTPDMGELTVVVTLGLIMSGSPPSRDAINGPFLEAIIRNVRWMLKDAPELEVVDADASEYRLVNTFARSRTSLRLIMFQVTFLDLFIKTYHAIGIEALDRSYGFPESGLPEKMVEEIKAIYRVNSWPEFFAKVQYPKARAQEFMKMFTDVEECGEHECAQGPRAFSAAVGVD